MRKIKIGDCVYLRKGFNKKKYITDITQFFNEKSYVIAFNDKYIRLTLDSNYKSIDALLNSYLFPIEYVVDTRKEKFKRILNNEKI